MPVLDAVRLPGDHAGQTVSAPLPTRRQRLRRFLTALVAVGVAALPLAVTPAVAPAAAAPFPEFAYVTNFNSGNVSVINTATNAVVRAPIPVGDDPIDVRVTSDGTRAYVVNYLSDTISVINTATNAVVATINLPAGSRP
ncbi:YncE family protein [Streptosporangium sp. NPDC000396]|uniref:YncE family protein n=1 Tax=Streptosporangium sp. NPDC000396 TaxID=3366185 RepID=UPI0036A257A1